MNNGPVTIEPLRVPFAFDKDAENLMDAFALTDNEEKELIEFFDCEGTLFDYMSKLNELNSKSLLSINQYMFLVYVMGTMNASS
jgi:hypothetical protein